MCGGRGLHSLDLGEQSGWDSKDTRGLRIDTLVVKGTLDEVDTGVARLIRGTGKVDELDSGLGLGRLAGSLGVV